jgi:hypothetical protein
VVGSSVNLGALKQMLKQGAPAPNARAGARTASKSRD